MTPEGRVKVQVRKWIASNNGWHCMPYGGGFGARGIPDFACCIEGQFVAIECKSGNNQPTVIQWAQLRAVEKAGGRAYVARLRDNVLIMDRVMT